MTPLSAPGYSYYVPTRRSFLSVLGAAAGLAACGESSAPSAGTLTGTFRAPLPDVGQTVAINNAGAGGQGIAVTRLTTNSVVAVSRRCTHQGCTVGLPSSPGANMNCPCHGSVFTTQGQVVSGPAQSNLTTYPAVIEGNEVVITVG